MAFSREVEERRQRREAERRDRALERRRADDRRDEEDERRREAAAAETRALEIQLDAEQQRRLTRIVQARVTRVGDRRVAAERINQRQRVLDAILHARRADADAAEAKRLRREQVAEALLRARAADHDLGERRRDDRTPQEARKARATDGGNKPRRPDRPETAETRPGLRERPGAREKRPDAPDDRPTSSREPSGAGARLRENDPVRAKREAADDQRRESRRRQREAASAETARQRAQRVETRDARHNDRLAAVKALEVLRATRDDRRRERLAGREEREAANRARLERAELARAPHVRREPEPSLPRDPLTDRLATGVLSGSLPWLTTKDNRVITVRRDPIVLRGVSVTGMDSAPPDPVHGYAAGAGITDALLTEASAWGANVVRVAISQQRVLASFGSVYLREVDGLVRRLAETGAYTLLSLRRLDEGTTLHPDLDTIGTWRLIAERYAGEPAVLFDLHSGPHTSGPDGRPDSWDRWTSLVQMTVASVRLVHPRALCVVEGLGSGADLSGFPISGSAGNPIPNLIYAAHLTPSRSGHWPAIQTLARRHPMFITEWGGSENDVTWGERTAQALRAYGIGWTAAHWNAEPALIRPTRETFAPTRFGMVVQRAFALSAPDTLAAPAAAATA